MAAPLGKPNLWLYALYSVACTRWPVLDGLYSTPTLELPYSHEQYYGFDSVSSFSQNHAQSEAK